MPEKETSTRVSSIAAGLLSEGRPYWMPAEYWTRVAAVAGSAMSQDETPRDSRVGYEMQGTSYDPDAAPHERVGRNAWGDHESQPAGGPPQPTEADNARWASDHDPKADDPLGR